MDIIIIVMIIVMFIISIVVILTTRPKKCTYCGKRKKSLYDTKKMTVKHLGDYCISCDKKFLIEHFKNY